MPNQLQASIASNVNVSEAFSMLNQPKPKEKKKTEQYSIEIAKSDLGYEGDRDASRDGK